MIVRQLETRLTAGDIAPRSLSNIKNAIQSMAELYLDAKGPGAWRLRWFWMFFFHQIWLWGVSCYILSESNCIRMWTPSWQAGQAMASGQQWAIVLNSASLPRSGTAVDLASARFPRKTCGNDEIHHGVKKSWFNLNIELFSSMIVS